jgi:hypothetical protein
VTNFIMSEPQSQPWLEKKAASGAGGQSVPHATQPSENSSKQLSSPIGKKAAPSGDDDHKANGDAKKDNAQADTARQAKVELVAFLSEKGLDLSKAAGVKIVLNHHKPGAPKNDRVTTIGEYSIRYRCPDGKDYSTKGEVFVALATTTTATNSGASSTSTATSKKPVPIAVSAARNMASNNDAGIRSDAFNNAKKRLDEIKSKSGAGQPVDIDGIKVFDFGTIDAHKSFSNTMQIYPCKYRAEITVEKTDQNEAFINEKDILPQKFSVAIMKSTDQIPVFIMKNLATGEESRKKSEQAAFRSHFPRIASGNEPGAEPWCSVAPFSFFNIELEGLIEGMAGSLTCKDYQFHATRGYGPMYTTANKREDIRKVLAAKSSAALAAAAGGGGGGGGGGNGVTQGMVLAPDDRKAAAEARKSLQDAKKRQKEETQRVKEAEKATQAAQKAASKKTKQDAKLAKQRAEAVEKARKEALKNANQAVKYRTAYRNDTKKAVARRQKEAGGMVMDAFDLEERSQAPRRKALTMLEQEEEGEGTNGMGSSNSNSSSSSSSSTDSSSKATTAAASDSASGMDVVVSDDLATVLIRQLQPLSSALGSGSEWGEGQWDSLLRLSVMLQSHNKTLGMQVATDPAALAKVLETVTGMLNAEPSVDPVPAPASVAVAVVKKETAEGETQLQDTPMEEEEGAEVEANFEDSGTIEKKDDEEEEEDGDKEEDVAIATLAQGADSAALDRVQLSMVQAVLAEAHNLLDIDAGEGMALPLNQMTWPEIARLALLNYVMRQCGLRREDAQHAVRGQRGQPGYRSLKNTIRMLRYRMQARSSQAQIDEANNREKKPFQLQQGGGLSGDRVMSLYQSCSDMPSIDAPPASPWEPAEEDGEGEDVTSGGSTVSRTPFNLFEPDAMGQLTNSLSAIAGDEGSSDDGEMPNAEHGNKAPYPEVYKRCARVLLRLVAHSGAKNVLWDSAFYRDLMTAVRRPLVLSNVASRLVLQRYSGSGDKHQYDQVAHAFYADIKAVLSTVNTYYTEAQPFLAQTQKLSTAAWRHCQKWLFAPKSLRPEIKYCTEAYCIESKNEIKPMASIKCGRCSAVYCLDYLHTAPVTSYLVKPSQEVIDKSGEEWICELCVKDDTFTISPTALNPYTNVQSYKDNANDADDDDEGRMYHGSFYYDEHGASAAIPHLLNPATSRVPEELQRRDARAKIMCRALAILASPQLGPSTALHPGAGGNDNPWLTPATTALHKEEGRVKPWSVTARLGVLSALSELVLTLPNTYSQVYEQDTEVCQRLLKLSGQAPFKEAEFLRVVRDLVGDEGIMLAKPLLKAINADKTSNDASSKDLDEIDSFRDKEEEEELMALAMDLRACEDPKPAANVPIELLKARVAEEQARTAKRGTCQYCGGSEVQMCSPLVVGHSAQEHDAHVSSYGDKARLTFPATTAMMPGVPEGSPVTVHLWSGSDALGPGPMPVPYFPQLESPDGIRLLEEMGKSGTGEAPVVVHQYCALHMFRARLTRSNHDLRKRRRLVAERIIAMSNCSLQPLGADRDGREYWKLPSTKALFVCEDVPPDSDKLRFKGVKNLSTSRGGSNQYRWSMVQGRSGVQAIINALHGTGAGGDEARAAEVALRSRLVELLDNEVAFPEQEQEQGQEEQQEDTMMQVHEEQQTQIQNEVAAVVKQEPADMTAAAAAPAVVAAPERAKREASLTSTGSKQNLLSNSQDGALALAQPALPDNQPVDLHYVPGKGYVIKEKYTLDEESAFEQDFIPGANRLWGDLDDDEEEEDGSHEQYLTFASRHRRYAAVSLYNQNDRKTRVPKGEVVVRYEIHRVSSASEGTAAAARATANLAASTEVANSPRTAAGTTAAAAADTAGLGEALITSELTEPWDDGNYYFCIPTFRRAGVYRVTFSVEPLEGYVGPTLSLVKPFCFDVTVRARKIVSGLADARSKLWAWQYASKAGRRSMLDRIRYSDSYENRVAAPVVKGPSSAPVYSVIDSSELDACKSALLAVFSALPEGALSLDSDNDDYAGAPTGAAEAQGWNDILEDVWFESIERATSGDQLMECVLVLEYYISKGWMDQPTAKLLASLPAPHYALRAATISAVALRIFCLDRSVNYSKVEARRSSRGTRGGGGASSHNNHHHQQQQSSSGRSSRGNKQSYAEVDGDDEEDYSSYGNRRSGRAASAAAQGRIRKQTYAYDEPVDEEDEVTQPRGGRKGSRRGAATTAVEFEEAAGGPADSWECPQCTMQNVLRARSCEACGGKRSSASTSAPANSHAAKKKRKRVVTSDDEEEEDEDEDEDDDEDVPLGEEEEEEDAGADADATSGTGTADEADDDMEVE